MRDAYPVCRDPNVLDRSISYSRDQQLPLGLDGAGSLDGSQQAMEVAWTEDAKHEDGGMKIKREDCEEEIPSELPFGYMVNQSFGLVESQGDRSQNQRHEEDFDHPIIPPHSFIDAISGVPNTFFETLYDPQLRFVDVNEPRAFFLSLPNLHLGPDYLYKEWMKEEWALAHFDYELACSTVFEAQLEEFQQRMHGLSQSPESVLAKLNVLDEMKDRLHVWPEKIIPAADALAESLTTVEESVVNKCPIAFDPDYGEAGELMDLWDSAGCVCG